MTTHRYLLKPVLFCLFNNFLSNTSIGCELIKSVDVQMKLEYGCASSEFSAQKNTFFKLLAILKVWVIVMKGSRAVILLALLNAIMKAYFLPFICSELYNIQLHMEDLNVTIIQKGKK